MIFYLGEKVDVVPKATRTSRNKRKVWQYGYDPEYDIVIVSKDGTLGDVYNISGLLIGLPCPPKRQHIKNGHLSSHHQRWERNPMPTGLNKDTMFQKRFEPYIEEEIRRRNEGHWLMIKGKAVWIPGTQYFFLNWIRLDEGYPDFRVIQNELMIFWEACKADPRCYGICYVKNRRFGWTSEAVGELLDSGTVVENKLLGIMSKTREDGKSVFSKLVMAFKRLPCFYLPIWDGTTTPKSELLLSVPTKKRAKNDDIRIDEGLNTRITFYSTVLNAMDGEKVFRSVLDESGKFPKETPFDRYWSIVKTSHRVGSVIKGKSMVGSTVNALDNGGREFKKVYYNSDVEKRSKNGQTVSGLYKLFIPAQYCIEGYFDQWGFSIVDDPIKPIANEHGELKRIGANTFLDNELESLKDSPAEYNEFLRQFARSEADAFRDDAGDCDFNLVKLYEQIDYNEKEMPEGIVQRGNFYWKDGLQDTEVIWTPNPKGRFRITNHPWKEYSNKFTWEYRHGVRAKAPVAEHLGAFGVDPYNRSRTAEGVGSKGSIHNYSKFNMEGWPSNQFIVEYIDRPRTVELFYEDVIMAMVYYSQPILAELSNEDFLKTLLRRGYRHYVLNRPDKKWRDLSPTEKELGGVPPQGGAIADAQYYAVEAFIEQHVGVADSGSNRPTGEMGRMYFNRTLIQWKDVNPARREKYDAYISSSLALLANQKPRHIKDAPKPRRFSMPFTKFNNRGKISHRSKAPEHSLLDNRV